MLDYKDYIKTISKIKPNNEKTLIYSLSDKTGIRYIGKTKQSLYSRYCEHISIKNSRSKLKYRSKNWIKSLINKNEYPIIELLDIVEDKNWENEEIFYIEYFRYLGFNLINHQIGGGKGNIGTTWTVSKDKLENKKLILRKERNNIFNLFDLQGNIISTFQNLMIASDELNISYGKLYTMYSNKTLINKQYILLKEKEIFTDRLLKRKYRKIKIVDNLGNIKIFDSLKETCNYLKIPISSIYKYLDKDLEFNNQIIKRI